MVKRTTLRKMQTMLEGACCVACRQELGDAALSQQCCDVKGDCLSYLICPVLPPPPPPPLSSPPLTAIPRFRLVAPSEAATVRSPTCAAWVVSWQHIQGAPPDAQTSALPAPSPQALRTVISRKASYLHEVAHVCWRHTVRGTVMQRKSTCKYR